jgi:hypothetical protein
MLVEGIASHAKNFAFMPPGLEQITDVIYLPVGLNDITVHYTKTCGTFYTHLREIASPQNGSQ